MTDRLLENNTVLKVLSVIVAIFIWFQARGVAQPINRTLTSVAVGYTTLNSKYTVLSINPAVVTVTIKGLTQTVNSTTASDVSALINLSNVKASGTYSMKVSATVPTGITPVSVTPNHVVVTIARIGKKKVPLVVHVSGDPSTGFMLNNYNESLKDATITGPSTALSQVRAVTGTLALSGHNATFTQQLVLQPVNAAGRTVSKVQVVPPTVNVTANIQKKLPEKVLPVVSQLTGQPKTGYTISQISVYPSTITVSGNTSALSGLTHVYTVPVNVSGATKTLTESVSLQTPKGTTLVSSGQVTVTVTIVKKG